MGSKRRAAIIEAVVMRELDRLAELSGTKKRSAYLGSKWLTANST